MRTFGKDTPEFFEFKIAGKKKTYKIPTQGSLPYLLTKRLAEIGAISDPAKLNAAATAYQYEILDRYIGEDAQEFSTEAVSELFSEWLAYSTETSGVDEGEFSGSSES